MDSGNSGSMQSSSGGDEEFDDSRGDETISSFFNHHHHHHQSGHFDPIISSSPSSSINPQLFLSHQSPTLFHPGNSNNSNSNSNNPDAITFPQSLSNLNSQYNNNDDDLGWIRPGFRPEPGFSNFTNLVPHQGLMINRRSLTSSQPLIQPTAEIRGSDDNNNNNNNNNNIVVSQQYQPKNPKKRTRASRRAPTTVLTTDTSNFRQMVQEFTGIPAAPFAAVNSPLSRRLDLFSAARSAHLDGLGPLYPLRPSAQKAQISPFLNTTSILGSGSNPDPNNISSQGPNLFNMQQQSQILNFNPLVQPSIRNNPLGNEDATEGILGNQNLGGFVSTDHGINDDAGNRMMTSFEGNSGNYKQNCSSSSTSDQFHLEKGLENVP